MLSIDSNSLQEIMATIGASISVAVAIVSIAGAFKAGVLRKVKIGSIEFEASDDDSKQLKEALAKNATPESKDRPFEIEQLANYYSQILSQSKISFWFSLIFRVIRFCNHCCFCFSLFKFKWYSNGCSIYCRYNHGCCCRSLFCSVQKCSKIHG